MASIRLQNIEKIYPGSGKESDVIAVKDFNLTIEDKEFVVLVGPSGCGKSTTLRMIAGLEEISHGELYIGDKLVNTVPPKSRDIAMVFQNYALYPHMTVFKNMAFALSLQKVPKKEITRRVHEVAHILGIEDLLERRPKELSGGQSQRVALGRAMVRNPAVFLLDEPLSNLDAKLRATMRTEIIKLHQDLETTFVYVTHDQTEAMTMGDRIVVMKDGIIQQVDTPQNLYEHPCNAFVAGFLGSPQMNFMNGILEKEGDVYCFNTGVDLLPVPKEKMDERLESYVGKEIRMGIRPESLKGENEILDTGAYSIIEAKVEVCELMGSEMYVYVQYNTTRMVGRFAPDSRIEAGTLVKVAMDTKKMHLFDIETEQAVTL